MYFAKEGLKTISVYKIITLFVFALGVVTIRWFILLYLREFTVETAVHKDTHEQLDITRAHIMTQSHNAKHEPQVDKQGTDMAWPVDERNVFQGLNKSEKERIEKIIQYKNDWENDLYSNMRSDEYFEDEEVLKTILMKGKDSEDENG